MKSWILLGLSILMAVGCQKNRESVAEAEFEHRDTLNLPHYPYIDYDETFKGIKLDKSELNKKRSYVQDFYENYWEYNQVSGGLLVAKNGKIIFEKYRGFANFETEEALTADTPIHIASISKVLTALAVLKLVEEDRLKLDQLVSNFYSAFPYKNVTVRDLLNHRSGLPNYAYFEHDDKYWNTNNIQTNDNVLEALVQGISKPYSSPNTTFNYSNTNYALLALIIEKVTGLTYPEAMKYIVFDPLKMDHTFVFNIKDSAKVSQSYTSRNKRWDFNFLDNIYGDKNIYSTPRDLFKMDKAMYAKKFLSEKLKKLMKQGYSYEKPGVKNYGLGIRLMEWDTGEKLWYHNGWWHGNYTTYVRGENDSISIIALGNKQIRSVYTSFSLIGLLGDYPITMELEDRIVKQDTLKIASDSLMPKLDKGVVSENLNLESPTKSSSKKKNAQKDSAKVVSFSTNN